MRSGGTGLALAAGCASTRRHLSFLESSEILQGSGTRVSARRIARLEREIMLDPRRDARAVLLRLLDLRLDRRSWVVPRRSAWLGELGRLRMPEGWVDPHPFGLDVLELASAVLHMSGWDGPWPTPLTAVADAIATVEVNGGVEAAAARLRGILADPSGGEGDRGGGGSA